MIVPGTRKYLTSLSQLAVGHHYSVDSGLGGSYKVQYNGQNKAGEHSFVRLPEQKHNFLIADKDITSSVFVIIPTEKYDRQQHDEEKHNRYIDLFHEQNCAGCLAARPRPLLAKLSFYLDVPLTAPKDVRSCINVLTHHLKKCSIGPVRIFQVEPKETFDQAEENQEIARSVINTMIGHYDDGDLKQVIGHYKIGTGVFMGTLVVFDAVEFNPSRAERTILRKTS